MHLNDRAALLSKRLHEICYDLGCLVLAARKRLGHEDAEELAGAVAAVTDASTRLHECDLVIDAARDEKDQAFGVAAD